MKKPNHIEWGIVGTTKDPNYIPPPADKYPGVDFEIDSRLLTLEQIKEIVTSIESEQKMRSIE